MIDQPCFDIPLFLGVFSVHHQHLFKFLFFEPGGVVGAAHISITSLLRPMLYLPHRIPIHLFLRLCLARFNILIVEIIDIIINPFICLMKKLVHLTLILLTFKFVKEFGLGHQFLLV
jgi:hypothetical protein